MTTSSSGTKEQVAESYSAARPPGACAQGEGQYRFRNAEGTAGFLPGPRSSRTWSAHSTLCAMSKYGNIFSLMTWLAMSRNASASIAPHAVLSRSPTGQRERTPFGCGSSGPGSSRARHEYATTSPLAISNALATAYRAPASDADAGYALSAAVCSCLLRRPDRPVVC